MNVLEVIGRALDAAEVKPQDVVDALTGAGYAIVRDRGRLVPPHGSGSGGPTFPSGVRS